MKSLKKIELHLHLEGAAPPALIRALAGEKHQDLEMRNGCAARNNGIAARC